MKGFKDSDPQDREEWGRRTEENKRETIVALVTELLNEGLAKRSQIPIPLFRHGWKCKIPFIEINS